MPPKRRTSTNRTTRKSATKKSRTGPSAAKKSGAGKSGISRSDAQKNSAKKTTEERARAPYEVRRSAVQGRGAFAIRPIRRGERIGEYKGERISWEEADARYDDESQERHHTFLFEVDDDTVIDAAVHGAGVKYINHSCDPNCEPVIEHGHVFIDAIRNIRTGEELFYDYNYILDEPHTAAVKKRYPCWCGSRKCRGTILGRKR
ncbi:MAG: SET domain-containing protein [Longimicrobiales bacterium]